MTQAQQLADLSQAYTAGALGFRNRLINGACAVQQRPVYTAGTFGYGPVDRFYASCNNSSMSVQGNGLGPTGDAAIYVGITSTGNNGIGIGQRIESANTLDLPNQPIVVTAWVYSDVAFTTSTFGCMLYVWNNKDNPNSWATFGANAWEVLATSGKWSYTRARFPALPTNAKNGFAVEWAFPAHANGQGCAVSVAQLELGYVNTPFERRPAGLEFALCQRYYENGNLPVTYLANVVANAIMDPIRFAESKRVAPTMAFQNVQYYSAGTVTPISANINAVGVDTGGASLYITGGMTSCNGIAGGSFTANAEL